MLKNTAAKAICDNIIRHMCWECGITKAAHTHTHTEYVQNILLLFHPNNGYPNAPQCCVIHTLPGFFFFLLSLVIIAINKKSNVSHGKP